MPKRLERLTGETERLLLRPLEEGDSAAYGDMLEASSESWAPWSPSQKEGLSPREHFFRERRRGERGAQAGTHLRLGVFEGDDLVGLVALNEIVRGAFQSAYASWQIRGDRTGAGFGTEAVVGLLAIAFAEAPDGLGLHRVQANVMPGNAASLRLAEKAGFRREGMAERYLKIAGTWEDHVMLAITVEEWRAQG